MFRFNGTPVSSDSDSLIEEFARSLNKTMVFAFPNFDLQPKIEQDAILTGVIMRISDLLKYSKDNDTYDMAMKYIQVLSLSLVTALQEVFVFEKSKYVDLMTSLLKFKVDLVNDNILLENIFIGDTNNYINIPTNDDTLRDMWVSLFYKSYGLFTDE